LKIVVEAGRPQECVTECDDISVTNECVQEKLFSNIKMCKSELIRQKFVQKLQPLSRGQWFCDDDSIAT